MLEENSKMIGLLTDFDHEIKQKCEEINAIKCQCQVNGGKDEVKKETEIEQFEEEDSPILRHFKDMRVKEENGQAWTHCSNMLYINNEE
jgi:hypothetical protein